MKLKKVFFTFLFILSLALFTYQTYAKDSTSYCWEWQPAIMDCYWPPATNCMSDIIVTPN